MNVAAVILAAGRSTRMGANKMLADVDGVPLIRRTATAVLASRASPVILVTGHQAKGVTEAVAGLDLVATHNPRYAEGLSTSLKAGIAAVSAKAAGAVICLGDMALIEPRIIDALAARLERDPGAAAVVPVHSGQWGNPVLVARKLFGEIARLSGDTGARKLLHGRADVEILPTDDAGVLLDVDTPEALSELRRRIEAKPAAPKPSEPR